MKSIPEYQRVDAGALQWAPMASMLYHNLESPNILTSIKVEVIPHSPQDPLNSLRVQKTFIDWKNVWMNQQLSIYFQGSCKNPNLSCHQQCKTWGSWAELRNLLWTKLLSLAPICRCRGPQPSPITLPLSFSEADPMQAALVGCFPASPT